MNLDTLNKLVENTLISHLKIEIISITNDLVELQMPVDERTVQPFRLLHGGASIALGETAASIGSLNICEADEICFGLQVSANHISTAKEGELVKAHASILHKGTCTHVWNVDITSLSTNKLISTMRITNCIRKQKIE